MDLDTQAELAVAEVLAGSGVTLGAVELAVARVAWLEGYKAGADATRKIAREVMEQA